MRGRRGAILWLRRCYSEKCRRPEVEQPLKTAPGFFQVKEFQTELVRTSSKWIFVKRPRLFRRVYGPHYVADLWLSRVDSSRSDVANWGRCRRHLRRNRNFNSFIISMCCLQFIISASNVSASMSVSLEDNYPACQLCRLFLIKPWGQFFDQMWRYHELSTSWVNDKTVECSRESNPRPLVRVHLLAWGLGVLMEVLFSL